MRISDWSSDVCSSDLNSIKATCFLYLRYGNGEIAVPLKSGGDECFQLRIGEELPPADFHRPPTEHYLTRACSGVILSRRQRCWRVRRGPPAPAPKGVQGGSTALDRTDRGEGTSG